MQKLNIALWCAITAAGIAGLAGCTGQATHIETTRTHGSESRATGEAAVGPVVKSTADYRKVRFAEAMRGLAIEGGRVVVDRDAARDLAGNLHQTDAAAAIKRGDALLAENDYTGAVGEFRLALLADSAAAPAYVGLGDAFLGKKKDSMALAAYRTATTHAPEDVAVRMKLAETINRIGDLKGWAEELENILALDPEHGQAHARLAVARYYLGDLETARRQLALADQFGGEVPSQLRAILSN
ncbi:hypothetical protein MNBD_PLANCTO03-388 [hydrothermal vent metagenome]|uniref:Uncharacterized protein n=1 Tax=hydrothermal vent metagenome TaxID=652676 RepID=A0A3B1DI35_9ZZZZ